MENLTTEKLIKGLQVISGLYPLQQITAISFEDGSGNKFNYTVDNKDHFIDLTIWANNPLF